MGRRSGASRERHLTRLREIWSRTTFARCWGRDDRGAVDRDAGWNRRDGDRRSNSQAAGVLDARYADQRMLHAALAATDFVIEATVGGVVASVGNTPSEERQATSWSGWQASPALLVRVYGPLRVGFAAGYQYGWYHTDPALPNHSPRTMSVQVRPLLELAFAAGTRVEHGPRVALDFWWRRDANTAYYEPTTEDSSARGFDLGYVASWRFTGSWSMVFGGNLSALARESHELDCQLAGFTGLRYGFDLPPPK